MFVSPDTVFVCFINCVFPGCMGQLSFIFSQSSSILLICVSWIDVLYHLNIPTRKSHTVLYREQGGHRPWLMTLSPSTLVNVCVCVCVCGMILDMHGSVVLLEIFIDCFFSCHLLEKQWWYLRYTPMHKNFLVVFSKPRTGGDVEVQLPS
jgi:hypothetical protein